MNSASPAPTKARPKYYDANLLHLPVPGLLSILHRISGVVMFLALNTRAPIVLKQKLRPESGFRQSETMLAHPLAKLVLLDFVWAYPNHHLSRRVACGLTLSRRHV